MKRLRVTPICWRVLIYLALWTTLPAAAQEVSDGQAPLTIAGVLTTLQGSLLNLWEAFLTRLPYLGMGLLALLMTWVVAALFRRSADRLLAARGMRPSLRELVERLAAIVIWAIGLLFAALVVFPNLTPAKALGGLGLLSIAVGLAFRDIFENFFAGILLLWNFPFENGDAIECQDIKGTVERVSVRMTLIRQFSGELLVVPNTYLLKNPVNVMTEPALRRISVRVVVAYGADMDQAMQVMADAVKGCDSVSPKKPVQIFPDGFGDSGLDIDVRWWTGSDTLVHRRSRAQVVPAVVAALRAADIEVALPRRVLELPQPLEIGSGGG